MLTDQVGDAVYIRGQANGYYKVARTDISISTKMPAVGVIIRKWGFTNALVQFGGEVRDIYTGLSPGKVYFINSVGRPVLPPIDPADVGGRAYTQILGVALDVGVLLIKPSDNLVVLIS